MRLYMQKQFIVLFTAVAIAALILTGCGFLFMGEEEQQFVGLWRSVSWTSSYDYFSETDYCYYDFTDTGKVYVTDWTEDFNFYEYSGIPVHFNYSVSDDTFSFTQFFGYIDMQFDIISITDTTIELEVTNSSADFDPPTYLTLTKIVDYDEEARAVKAVLEEYADEIK